jgi:hypothetical protein
VIIEYNIPSPVDVKALNIFVRALCAYDVLWLRRNPSTPNIYESGVRYRTQPVGVEQFKPIPMVIAAGEADCDQLAPWRAAELRERHGIKALPEVRQMGKALFHVYVRLPDGKVEDVSARLGMAIPKKIVAKGREILAQKGRRNRVSERVHTAGSLVLGAQNYWG